MIDLGETLKLQELPLVIVGDLRVKVVENFLSIYYLSLLVLIYYTTYW